MKTLQNIIKIVIFLTVFNSFGQVSVRFYNTGNSQVPSNTINEIKSGKNNSIYIATPNGFGGINTTFGYFYPVLDPKDLNSTLNVNSFSIDTIKNKIYMGTDVGLIIKNNNTWTKDLTNKIIYTVSHKGDTVLYSNYDTVKNTVCISYRLLWGLNSGVPDVSKASSKEIMKMVKLRSTNNKDWPFSFGLISGPVYRAKIHERGTHWVEEKIISETIIMGDYTVDNLGNLKILTSRNNLLELTYASNGSLVRNESIINYVNETISQIFTNDLTNENWVVLDSAGFTVRIGKIDFNKKEFKSVYKIPMSINTNKSFKVNNMHFDKKGNVWISTQNHGVMFMNMNITHADTGVVTSMEEINSNNEVSVYPNPSNGEININLNEKINEVILVNSIGQTEVISVNNLNNKINTSLKGNIIMMIKTNNNTIVKKIQVN